MRAAVRASANAFLRSATPENTALQALAGEVAEISELTLGNPVIYDRFADTAVLRRDDARALGCLGYVDRASGISTDARCDPFTISDEMAARGTILDVTASMWESEDVLEDADEAERHREQHRRQRAAELRHREIGRDAHGLHEQAADQHRFCADAIGRRAQQQAAAEA